MSTPLPISGPLSLGDLLDRAFRLYRARFWPLTLAGALCIVPVALLSAIVSGVSITSFTDAMQGLSRSTPSRTAAGSVAGLYGSSLLQVVLLGLGTGLAQLAMTAQSIAALHGESMTLGASLRAGLRRLLPWIGQNLVQWFAIFGAMILVYLPLACVSVTLAVGTSGSSSSNALALGGTLLLTVVACLTVVGVFAPLVYLLARWIVAVPALVTGADAVDGLRESWRLTKGQVWRAVLYTFLLFVLSFLITSLPAFAVQWLITTSLGPRQLGLASALSQGVGSIIRVLWLPVYVAGLVLLYYDLRVRQEGYDLALRIEQLEADVTPLAPSSPALGEGVGDA